LIIVVLLGNPIDVLVTAAVVVAKKRALAMTTAMGAKMSIVTMNSSLFKRR